MERDQEKHDADTRTDVTIILGLKTAPAWIPSWWESKVPDSLDERWRLFQTKSLNNRHFIYMADTEWGSILIDSCLFAKDYDVEKCVIKKGNLFIGL